MKSRNTKTTMERKTENSVLGINRRSFIARSAVLGVAAGTAGVGINPTTAFAESGKLNMAGASGFEPLEVDSPMAKWKKPQPLDFVTAATERYSFRNWQSGNDDSVFYNLNLSGLLQVQRRDATERIQCA